MPAPETMDAPNLHVGASTEMGAQTLRRALGGAIGAFVSVAIVLSLGVVALAPLGAQAAAVGGPPAFVTVIVSAALFSVLSRCALPAGSPSSATAIIMAALVAEVARSHPISGDPRTVQVVIVCVGASVVLMGLLQVLMATLKLAQLSRYVPQPVLAGFLLGIAVLIALAQLPALLNLELPLLRIHGWRALLQGDPGSIALGLGTAVLIWQLARRAPRIPAALVGMLTGVAVFHAVRAAAPMLELGGTLGPVAIPHTLPGLLDKLQSPGAAWTTLAPHASAVTITAVSLALVGSLESMLNFRATDQELGTRHDATRDLLAMGLCNVVGGLLGALPMVQVRARASAILRAGGRGRVAGFAAAAASALMLGLGSEGLSQLPRTVLAGVMLTIAVSLADPATWRLLRHGRSGGPAVRTSLMILGLVALLTVWQGTAAGVAAGLVLSTLVFMHGMNRSLVRSRTDALSQPSRRAYPPALEPRLEAQARQIQILELEGALFFGTAERVSDEAERLPAQTRFLILDLRRVGTIDESGVVVLRQLHARLARRGVELLLAGVAPGGAQWQQLEPHLVGASGLGWGSCLRDIDRAVEFAELKLLADGPGGVDVIGARVPVEQCNLFQGLSAAQMEAVTGLLQTLRLKPGERLFSEGDPGLGLYVLERGSVTVVNARGQRYLSFSPGTIVGELAMLDGRGRTASAVADSEVEIHRLSREAMAQLAATDPALSTLLYRNIAIHLAQRLRLAAYAWRLAES